MTDPRASDAFRSPVEHLRKNAGAAIADGFFRGLANLGRLHPRADPSRHRVSVTLDHAYSPRDPEHHRYDLYRPDGTPPPEGWPVVLYLHGGGFRILSKDTHWLMGLAFARKGYLVVNASYRLAPRHPFPAAIEDGCEAYAHMIRELATLGADPQRVVIAGESAGANLAASVALACCYPHTEPFAKAVYDLGVVPRAVVAACGIFQVSDTHRFARRRPLPWWLSDRLLEVTEAYLGRSEHPTLDLADPLVLLERGVTPSRPIPPFFLPVGTRDPLLDDTRRMHAALTALHTHPEARYYPGEVHAFHAFIWRKAARQCWRDTYDFLDAHLGPTDR